MSVETDIRTYLTRHGRSTVNEIAIATGYSNGYVRETAKDMVSDGQINGTKGKRIPAVIINGNYVVVTSDRQHLLNIIQRHAPQHRARARGMSISQLQDFIRETLAQKVVGGPRPWEFWP